MTKKNAVDLKRIFTFGLALVVVLGALCLCLEKCLERADLLYKDGTVEIRHPGSKKWVSMTEDTRIGRGCEIRTGEAGTVELELPDKCFVKVGPNSHVAVNGVGMVEITKRAGNSVELIYGKARALVAPFVNRRSRFSIRSEGISIGVRGTDFGVIRPAEAETTRVLGLDGEVTVRAKREELVIKADEEVTAVEGEIPDEAEKLPEDFKAKFIMEMDFVSLRAREWIRDDLKSFGIEAEEEVIELELPEPEVAGEVSGEAGSYTVTEGDSLWTIAEKFYGDGYGYTALYDANREKVELEDLIYPGQTLMIPPLEGK